MNKKLLLRVKAQILAEPKQFIMGTWYTNFPDIFDGDLWEGVKVPNCGTAACIAGWIVALHNNIKLNKAIGGHGTAAMYLNIRRYEANRLFYVENWPGDLRARWDNAKSLEERAQIAAERIDRFIAEHDK